jgi:hypothetical protein
MNRQLNEYLVETNSIPHRQPPATQPVHLRPRRLRMARWAQRIQPR